MTLAEFAVKRPQFTLVLFLMLAVLGFTSALNVPKAEDPSFASTNFGVIAVLPGASPRDVERLVVDAVEARVKRLDDLKSIKTRIDDSVAVVEVEFRAETDGDRRQDELEREMTSLRSELPAELAKLEVKRFDPSKVSAVQVAIASETAPYRELERTGKALEKRLENIRGVGDVQLWGLPKQEVAVSLDLDRLVALRLQPAEILTALSTEGALVPAGGVVSGGKQFNVKASGDYRSIEDVENTFVRVGSGQSLRLRDVATVRWRDGEQTHFSRVNGKRAIFVSVPIRQGEDIFHVRKLIDAELTSAAQTSPHDVHITFDQAENVSHRLRGFLGDFGIAILLVLITLLPLGLRASGVVMVSIPLSIAMGVTALHALGFSINQLSIVGFVIALGLLVDDSVVVVENIARFLRKGASPKDAAIRATKQITASVLGCTATLILAFLPLLFLPGAAGRFIRSLPTAVVVTVAASLIVSLSVVPFLSSRFLRPEKHEGNRIFQGMSRFIEASYRPILGRALAYPKTALLLATLLAAGAFALVPRIGFSLFPKANLPQFLVTIEGPEDASTEEIDRAAHYAEGVIAKHAGGAAAQVMTTVGRGNPQVYYNVGSHEERSSYGEIFVRLTHFKPEETLPVYERMRADFAQYGAARIELKEFENGPPLDAPIAIRVLGDDEEGLRAAARSVQQVLEATPGTMLVRNPSADNKADVRIRVDKERAALFGVFSHDVDRSARLAIDGIVAAHFKPAGHDESMDIRLILERPGDHEPVAKKPTREQLERILVPSHTGAPVRLSQVADVTFEPSATSIRHYNKERSTLVTAQVARSYNTDRVTKDALSRLESLKLPPGIRLRPAGEIENREESLGGMGGAVAIAIFGILGVLVLEFRTFRGTLIVASVIPFGIAGGLVALFLNGDTLSFTANVGFVALMGIEVKNSILLVDFTNQLRADGYSIDEAIQKAGEVRFVPILLTTLTALGGLIPLALERSPLYSPLAIVLIGGLVSSTLVARIVTPVVYKLLRPSVEHVEGSGEGTPASFEAAAQPTGA
ncbi:MAG: efflux RND transporter permease subunit [Polyangiaceae bacterium]